MGINWDIIKIKNTFEKLCYGDGEVIKKELEITLHKYKKSNVNNHEANNRIEILTKLIKEYT